MDQLGFTNDDYLKLEKPLELSILIEVPAPDRVIKNALWYDDKGDLTKDKDNIKFKKDFILRGQKRLAESDKDFEYLLNKKIEDEIKERDYFKRNDPEMIKETKLKIIKDLKSKIKSHKKSSKIKGFNHYNIPWIITAKRYINYLEQDVRDYGSILSFKDWFLEEEEIDVIFGKLKTIFKVIEPRKKVHYIGKKQHESSITAICYFAIIGFEQEWLKRPIPRHKKWNKRKFIKHISEFFEIEISEQYFSRVTDPEDIDKTHFCYKEIQNKLH